MAHIFRADKKNVGDWYCPPFRYFPFKPSPIGDILDPCFELGSEKVVLLGGGGLGTKSFMNHLKRLKSSCGGYKLIAWGVGVDEVCDRSRTLEYPGNYELFGEWFDGFDDVGIRVYSESQKYRYVPCASCMNALFFKYRDIKPKRTLGVYSHKRVPLHTKNYGRVLKNNNNGNNLEKKLAFLSNHEFILTNTYHGVFWATLLSRKVICIPFKSGCLSFKHPPVYCAGEVTDEILHEAKSYPNSLEECRKLNISFYSYLTSKYGDI